MGCHVEDPEQTRAQDELSTTFHLKKNYSVLTLTSLTLSVDPLIHLINPFGKMH